jgi:hypothetical protein
MDMGPEFVKARISRPNSRERIETREKQYSGLLAIVSPGPTAGSGLKRRKFRIEDSLKGYLPAQQPGAD